MSTRHVLESQQSLQPALPGRAVAAGCWKLAPGRALSLHPRQQGVLEIAQGRVWVTLSRAATVGHWGGATADHVLQAGESLAIAAGEHVVMEAWSPAGMPPEGVAFHWAAAAALQAGHAPSHSAQWERGVAQPLRDLGEALAQGGRAVGRAGIQAAGATGRLVLGFARFALFCIAAPQYRRTI